MEEKMKFDVLLDKNCDLSLFATCLDYTSRLGVVDSIQDVHQAGLLQVPTYMVVKGRGLADQGVEKPNNPVWTKWCHTLGERLTLSVPVRCYNGIPGGLQVVDIQGAGLF